MVLHPTVLSQRDHHSIYEGFYPRICGVTLPPKVLQTSLKVLPIVSFILNVSAYVWLCRHLYPSTQGVASCLVAAGAVYASSLATVMAVIYLAGSDCLERKVVELLKRYLPS